MVACSRSDDARETTSRVVTDAQVNLHLTGHFHAVTAAHSLGPRSHRMVARGFGQASAMPSTVASSRW
jgi:hypothetical protein